jgi:hypothetical protein
MGAVAGAVMQGDRVLLTEGRYRLKVPAGAPGWVLPAVAPSVFSRAGTRRRVSTTSGSGSPSSRPCRKPASPPPRSRNGATSTRTTASTGASTPSWIVQASTPFSDRRRCAAPCRPPRHSTPRPAWDGSGRRGRAPHHCLPADRAPVNVGIVVDMHGKDVITGSRCY